MSKSPITGGCQCGAVRYQAEGLGRPSICHCRMCQKAFGSFFAPLVTTKGFAWVRGEAKWFQSSNKVRRGFCGDCGTPLAYDYGGDMEIAVGSMDEPERAAPVIQVNPTDKQPFFDGLHALPFRDDEASPAAMEFMADIENYQHPDHPTDEWELKR